MRPLDGSGQRMRAVMNVDVTGTDPQIHRQSVALSAFRRNDDVRAAELRSELPLLLGRLAAEVPHSTIQLHVATDADGVVSGLMTVEAGSTTEELLADVCALLDPVAELTATSLPLWRFARRPQTLQPCCSGSDTR